MVISARFAGSALAFVFLWPLSVHATDFTDKTRCRVIVAASLRQDNPEIQRAMLYVISVFRSLDSPKVARGHNGLYAILSDNERKLLIVDAFVTCAQNPDYTAHTAALAAYYEASKNER